MSDNPEEKTILNCFGDEFFETLTVELKINIPATLKNVLFINDIDCAQVISRVDDETILRIENFMKNEFSISTIVGDNPQIGEYLGKYEKCQKKFCFSIGHKIILKLIVEHCAEKLCIASPFGTPKQLESVNKIATVNESPEEQEATKKKLINLLFQSVFGWMKNKPIFAEVFHAIVKT